MNYIINPKNNNKVSIYSVEGLNILRNFIKKYKYGGNKFIEIELKDIKGKKNKYKLELIKRIGEKSNNGEIYKCNLYKKNKKVINNEIIKLVPINNKAILNEIKIGIKMGKMIKIDNKKTSIGPKIYYYNLINKFEKQKEIFDKVKKLGSNLTKKVYLGLIVMKLLEGNTLNSYLKLNNNKISGNNINLICKKIKMMHKLKYIHNDLHLNNIFMDKKEPYIIDYGLSQRINSKKESNYLKFLNDKDFNKYIDYQLKSHLNNNTNINKEDQFCTKAGWACERQKCKYIFSICNIIKALNEFNLLKRKKKYDLDLIKFNEEEKVYNKVKDYIKKVKNSLNAGVICKKGDNKCNNLNKPNKLDNSENLDNLDNSYLDNLVIDLDYKEY
tara:strand:+ start:1538 stop:2692 length:1155 start_codon:yes stop_codon:yes gene_type:complete